MCLNVWNVKKKHLDILDWLKISRSRFTLEDKQTEKQILPSVTIFLACDVMKYTIKVKDGI